MSQVRHVPGRLRVGVLLLLALALCAGLPVAIASAATPLAFNCVSQLDGLGPSQPVFRQDFATGASTKLGDFGQHAVWWDAGQRYAVSAAARYDEAYWWLDAQVHDTVTGNTIVLTDVNGTPLPEIAGGLTFGGFSADGSRFALVLMALDEGNPAWPFPRVLVFNSSTGRAVGGTWCNGSTSAAISPDGTRVVYSWGGEGASTLWMYDLSAGTDTQWMNTVQLDTSDAAVVTPFWPTTGGEIVVNIEDAYSRRHVHVGMINPTTKSIRYVNSQAGIIYDVTADGRYALVESQQFSQYVGLTELGRLDLTTGAYIRTLSVSTMQSFVMVPRATLSPDGTRVLIEGWLEKGLQGHSGTYPSNIYRCSVTGTGLEMVAMDVRCPSWVAGEVAPLAGTALSNPAVSPTTPRRGKPATFRTYLTPAAPAAVGPIKLYLYRWETKRVRQKVRGRWKTVSVKYWRLRATKTMTRTVGGRFAVTYKPPYAGKWKMQARCLGSIDFTASSSRVKLFTVK
jgi:hypothetical protein